MSWCLVSLMHLLLAHVDRYSFVILIQYPGSFVVLAIVLYWPFCCVDGDVVFNFEDLKKVKRLFRNCFAVDVYYVFFVLY